MVLGGFSFALLTMAGQAAGQAGGPIQLDNPLGTTNWEDVFKKIIDAVTKVVGAAAVLAIVIAGFYFIFSSGEPDKVKTAKTVIIYGLLGMIAAFSAKALMNTIKGKAQSSGGLSDIINNIAWELVTFVGIIALALVIAGGYQILTSGGSQEKVTAGKNKIIYAIIGMIVALSAWAIVKMVISAF